MQLIEITEEMVKIASEYAIETIKNLKNKPNYTGLTVENRYFCGYLGEQVFKRLLDINNKKYEYKVRCDGVSDNGDFLLFTKNDLAKTADVKTACKKFHKMIMMPKKQADFKQYYCYIGVRLCDSVGEIYGYCYIDEFKHRPEGFNESNVYTLYKELDILKDINELLFEIADS